MVLATLLPDRDISTFGVGCGMREGESESESEVEKTGRSLDNLTISSFIFAHFDSSPDEIQLNIWSPMATLVSHGAPVCLLNENSQFKLVRGSIHLLFHPSSSLYLFWSGLTDRIQQAALEILHDIQLAGFVANNYFISQ